MKWRRDSFPSCPCVFFVSVMFVGPLKQPLICPATRSFS
jgi:hypothetical protein